MNLAEATDLITQFLSSFGFNQKDYILAKGKEENTIEADPFDSADEKKLEEAVATGAEFGFQITIEEPHVIEPKKTLIFLIKEDLGKIRTAMQSLNMSPGEFARTYE